MLRESQFLENDLVHDFYLNILEASNGQKEGVDLALKSIITSAAPELSKLFNGANMQIEVLDAGLAVQQRVLQKRAFSERFDSSYDKPEKNSTEEQGVKNIQSAPQQSSGPSVEMHPNLMTGGLWTGTSMQWLDENLEQKNIDNLSQKNKNRNTLTLSFDDFKPEHTKKYKNNLMQKEKLEFKHRPSVRFTPEPQKPF